MKVIFARNHRIGSLLIRLFTVGNWSHVGILTPHGVVETTWPRGVHLTPLKEFNARNSTTEVVDIGVPDELAAVRWLIAQLGKGYDWSAILGFMFRESWARPNRWFCSELLEGACIAGGRRRFREKLHRITPKHSWMVSP